MLIGPGKSETWSFHDQDAFTNSASEMYAILKESSQLILSGLPFLSRGTHRKKKGRGNMHDTAEWSNIELLTELIHTVVWSTRVLAILHWCTTTNWQEVRSQNPLFSSAASSSGQTAERAIAPLAPELPAQHVQTEIESLEIAKRQSSQWHNEYQRRITDSNCKLEELSRIARFNYVVAQGQSFQTFGDEPTLSGKSKPVCKEYTQPQELKGIILPHCPSGLCSDPSKGSPPVVSDPASLGASLF